MANGDTENLKSAKMQSALRCAIVVAIEDFAHRTRTEENDGRVAMLAGVDTQGTIRLMVHNNPRSSVTGNKRMRMVMATVAMEQREGTGLKKGAERTG